MNMQAPMAVPFIGERYDARKSLSVLLAPPYDVISAKQRETLAATDPHNVVHVLLPAGDDDRYARAARTLTTWRGEGTLVADREPSVTVVRQRFKLPDGLSRSRTGVIVGVAVEEFSAGRVRPHEKTHAGPKADRLALLRASRTVMDALLMISRDPDETLLNLLQAVTEGPPTAEAILDDVSLALWVVTGSKAKDVAAAASAGPLYIADGHHRYETALAYARERSLADRTLALVVPLGDPGLSVLPTHRIVYGESVDSASLLKEFRAHLAVLELSGAEDYVSRLSDLGGSEPVCALVLPDRVALLGLQGRVQSAERALVDHPAVMQLDVARADAFVLRRLLQAAGTAAKVRYTPDPNDVAQAVTEGAVGGVVLNPPAVDQVLAVADAGATMPQKSTYFVPKVPSGIVLLRHD